MKTARFKVEGMHCQGCVDVIQALLEREPGVRRASVFYAEGEARILFDSSEVEAEERLVATIERAGYRVTGQK